MHRLQAAACLKTQGLNHCTDLTDPHTAIPNTVEVLPRDRVTMAAAEEAVGEEEEVWWAYYQWGRSQRRQNLRQLRQ
jgi:hypothetical protein